MPPAFSLKLGQHLDTPETKKTYNAALFTEVAPRYDLVTGLLSFGRDAAWKRALVRSLPTDSAPVCVDLACGTGDITRLLARRFPAATVLGLDLTPGMLSIAARKTADPRIRYHQSDMCETGLPDASVDIVTGGYALRNAPSLEVALQEVHRILRPGGTAAFLDFSKPSSRPIQIADKRLLAFWGGLWGFVLHRNPSVYGYIAKSLERFPDRQAFTRLLTGSGFRVVKRRSFFLGIMELVYIEKPT